jgi:hypothetical protein
LNFHTQIKNFNIGINNLFCIESYKKTLKLSTFAWPTNSNVPNPEESNPIFLFTLTTFLNLTEPKNKSSFASLRTFNKTYKFYFKKFRILTLALNQSPINLITISIRKKSKLNLYRQNRLKLLKLFLVKKLKFYNQLVSLIKYCIYFSYPNSFVDLAFNPSLEVFLKDPIDKIGYIKYPIGVFSMCNNFQFYNTNAKISFSINHFTKKKTLYTFEKKKMTPLEISCLMGPANNTILNLNVHSSLALKSIGGGLITLAIKSPRH